MLENCVYKSYPWDELFVVTQLAMLDKPFSPFKVLFVNLVFSCCRCYSAEQQLDDRERHPSNSRDTHKLHPVSKQDSFFSLEKEKVSNI